MTSPPPQYGQQPDYYQSGPAMQPSSPPPSKGMNVLGLFGIILGVLGLGLCWIPWIGFAGLIVGLAGLVFGILGLTLQQYRNRRTLAIYGTALSSLAFFLSTFLPILTGMWWTWNLLEEQGTIDSFETLFEQEYETYNYDEPETTFGTSQP